MIYRQIVSSTVSCDKPCFLFDSIMSLYLTFLVSKGLESGHQWSKLQIQKRWIVDPKGLYGFESVQTYAWIPQSKGLDFQFQKVGFPISWFQIEIPHSLI